MGPVMMHVPKNKRLKWDKKAVQFILVGYSENVKGYRLYNPETRKICTSRDVIVMEQDTVPIEINEGQIEKQLSVQEGSSTAESEITLTNRDDPTYVFDSDKSTTSTEGESYHTLSEGDLSENEEPGLMEKRIRKPPERYGFTNLCVSDESESWAEDITYDEATNGPEKDKWQQAMSDELLAFEDNQAWEIVSQKEADRVVQCKWVFKKKPESDNSVRYRARLVAKGYTQQHGVDFNETYSPVLRYSTLRLLFALSVKLNFEITHLDVVTAFLNGYLTENVYMQAPPSLNCPNNCVLKLKKAVYGLNNIM